MSWTDYKVPTIMVDPGDGVERPVRGLSLDDMGLLIVNNLDPMMEIAALYISSQKDVFASNNATDLMMVAAKNFPDFVSEVISMVTDTPELRRTRLPAGVQLTILQAAMKLTVQDAGGMGNLSAMLSNAARAAMANRGDASRKLQDILSPSSTTGAAKTRAS